MSEGAALPPGPILFCATASTANETGKETSLAMAVETESPCASWTYVFCHFDLSPFEALNETIKTTRSTSFLS